jgi:arylsulfatase A-like enzyme
MKTFYLSLILSSIAHWTLAQAPPGPNVILIMADDQGYGDIRAHGHPFIRTPNMDRLHAESVRFTDFHVAPMCTPTRGQLLTGVDAMKNGATAVCQGRSMIRREIPTLADYFAGAGYRTILSGKWHLGDSYPHRPQDRGFQEVLSFRAWGLPSLASHWANSYINPEAASDSYHDPVLEYNGTDKPYQGYVTDIFFDHAMEQIEASRKADQPFFVYIATPTPHTPNISPPEKVPFYQELDPYEGKKVHTHYYGMIENIDDNLGRIERFINDQGLRDNTILIYLSDNGTQSQLAKEMYNAGMRAKKTSVYEGGHRVPLFVRWPDGDLKHGQDVAELTQVQDLCPTLLTLCGIKPNDLYPQSGHDLTPLLKGAPWPHAERTLIVQYMAGGRPWKPAVAMQGPWRLVNEKELYHIREDPHQDRNIAAQHPERLAALDQAYRDWYKEAHAQFVKPRYIDLGHPDANPTILYASDWEGGYCDNPGGLMASKAKGVWHVNVIESGKYSVELSRWPFEADKLLTEGVNPDGKQPQRGARPIAAASIEIGAVNQRQDAAATDRLVRFKVDLKAGKQELKSLFYDKQGNELCSANYARVTKEN